MMHGSYFVNFFVSLVAIMNPLGNMAIFLALTQSKTAQEQRKIAIATAIAVFVTMVVTLWVGEDILKALGISISAFEAGGGLVILLVGLSMLHAQTSQIVHSPKEQAESQEKDSVAVVPLAIPIIAGPGAMTTIIIAGRNITGVAGKTYLSAECLIISTIIGVILFFAPFLARLLGVSGVKIASRVMGLLLVAIAASMIAAGLRQLFPVLG